MGNILPDRLFRDNRNTKLSEITHLLCLIYLRNVFFFNQKFGLYVEIIQRRQHYQQQRTLKAQQHFGQHNQ